MDFNMMRFLRSLFGRKHQSVASAGQWTGSSYVDKWKRTREPTANQLVEELKGIAWACISLNAATCASYEPQLYVTTKHNQPNPKCETAPLSAKTQKRFERDGRIKSASKIEEITNHPLLTLLKHPNPLLSSFDMWELTQTYLETTGRAYWHTEEGPFGVPNQIWVLPSQNVTPKREKNSPNPVDYYEYRAGATTHEYPAEEIIFFKYPDPRSPYLGGLSPLRACYEQVMLTSEFAATKAAIYENRGIPSALVTPTEVIGEEERARLEIEWSQRFKKGGAGKVLVAESAMNLQLLQQSMGDLAALADMRATKDDIANAFHVPTAFFTTNTNLANLQASQSQHMAQAIRPRLTRRDELLNNTLVPLFDPDRRIFLVSEDPTPINQRAEIAKMEVDLKYGIITINEERGNRGLPPVPWGEKPWLPNRWTQIGEKQ